MSTSLLHSMSEEHLLAQLPISAPAQPHLLAQLPISPTAQPHLPA